MTQSDWERLGEQPQPSWYLDPMVARQKRDVHLDLVHRWLNGSVPGSILKTDLFEEGFGEDRILPDLQREDRFLCGMDESTSTTRAAARRFDSLVGRVLVNDVRSMAIRSGAFDLVLSTSTLDHFSTRGEFLQSLEEIHRIIAPGGLLILTLDNPRNPFYGPLRAWSRTGSAPFFLGYAPAMRTLRRDLDSIGFRVESEDWLIHNPRMLSTALFLLLRRALGRRGDGAVSFLLRMFALLDKLPTLRLSACFQAVAARKCSA